MDELGAEEIEQFIAHGYVRVAGAFSREVAEACSAILYRLANVDPSDRATWTKPVVRIGGRADPPFQAAADSERLRRAHDQLVGAGRWQRRLGLGTFPIRFPHADAPDDAGWHVDGGYQPAGEPGYWLNLRSRGRALLMIFLLTDAGPDDAPTRIKVGSHLDVPRFLAPAGEAGLSVMDLCVAMDREGVLDSAARPTAFATGEAGDVYLCHPFLVHGAQAHRGTRPRIIAQPPLEPTGLLELEREDGDYSAVELAVRRGLGLRT